MNEIGKGPLQEAEAPVNDVTGTRQLEGLQLEKPFSRLSRVLTLIHQRGKGALSARTMGE